MNIFRIFEKILEMITIFKTMNKFWVFRIKIEMENNFENPKQIWNYNIFLIREQKLKKKAYELNEADKSKVFFYETHMSDVKWRK